MPNTTENSKVKCRKFCRQMIFHTFFIQQDTKEDIWDDTLIIKAYEESMKLAKEEVAKRLANATNNKSPSQKKVESPGSSKQQQQQQPKDFKIGDFCRATYEDGVDYEAKIISIDSSGQFLIRYVGYENEEYKQKSDLVPTWGKKARKQQKSDAKQSSVGADEGSESGVSMEADFGTGQVLFERPKSGTKTQTKVRKNPTNVFFPPPPPMPPMLEENLEDAENLSAMLMSWYMSGYYTGLYQGQKMAAQQKRKTH